MHPNWQDRGEFIYVTLKTYLTNYCEYSTFCRPQENRSGNAEIYSQKTDLEDENGELLDVVSPRVIPQEFLPASRVIRPEKAGRTRGNFNVVSR